MPCLLADHDSIVDPTKIQNPAVERLVSLQPDQSLSQKTVRVMFGSSVIASPAPNVPLTYLSVRFRSPKSATVGACIL